MQMVAAILGGLFGASLGYAVFLLGALLIMSLMGVSDFEGKRAVMAGFVFGPVGAVAGLALGIWLALRWFPRPADTAPTWGLNSLILIGFLVAAALVGYWLMNSGPLGQNTAAPRLSFEIRVPARLSFQHARVNLDTDKNQMPAELKAPQPDDGWTMISGDVELYHRTSRRLLVLDLGNGRQHIFKLKLRASPSNMPEWSDWQKVDSVFSSPGQKQGAPPAGDDVSEMRLRVTVF